MAVYVYKTGVVLNSPGTAVTINVNTVNDDLGTNSQNLLVWSTPNAATKTLATAATATTIAANQAHLTSFTLTSAVTAFEVEVRYSNPNMVPRVTVAGGDVLGTPLSFAAGTLYFASSQTENP
ncbi:MAG: hypothetical protein J7639_13595 [Paenibacillaceae bacterium]|nr:hypothetical protein [Paenibacillaceae bacterium]